MTLYIHVYTVHGAAIVTTVHCLHRMGIQETLAVLVVVLDISLSLSLTIDLV